MQTITQSAHAYTVKGKHLEPNKWDGVSKVAPQASPGAKRTIMDDKDNISSSEKLRILPRMAEGAYCFPERAPKLPSLETIPKFLNPLHASFY